MTDPSAHDVASALAVSFAWLSFLLVVGLLVRWYGREGE